MTIGTLVDTSLKMMAERTKTKSTKIQSIVTPFLSLLGIDADEEEEDAERIESESDNSIDAHSSLESLGHFPSKNFQKSYYDNGLHNNQNNNVLLNWTKNVVHNMSSTTSAVISTSTSSTTNFPNSDLNFFNSNATNTTTSTPPLFHTESTSNLSKVVVKGQDILQGGVWWDGGFYTDETQDQSELPAYLWITAFIFLLVIFVVGTVGNSMVIIVINCSRDMRTSTNIFLVNLSLADFLLLIICTPTCFIEILVDPNDWILGAFMCKLVPLLETTVANVSVLTILAISFERYYAICCPLQANFICTKARAFSVCFGAWIAGFTITSPIYFMTNYYTDNDQKPHCDVLGGIFWADFYTISSIVLLFLLPLLILIVTYGLIAQKLTTTDRCHLNKNDGRQNIRARKQVVIMLGTVVFTFFLCLLPFRVLTILIVLSEQSPFDNTIQYYNFLYFCRIMIYLNSSLNPILYNIMSSKFRNGFLILCSTRRRKLSRFKRQGTFLTTTTTTSNNNTTTSIIPLIPNFIHATSLALPVHEDDISIEDEKSGDTVSLSSIGHVGHPRLAIRFNNGPVCYQLRGVGHRQHDYDERSTAFGEIESYYSKNKCRRSCNCHCHSEKNLKPKALLKPSGRKCRFYCSNRNFSMGHGGTGAENFVEKHTHLTLNCHRKGKPRQIIQAATGKKASGEQVGGGGKLTIKMKANYYTCSFASFSNTNTLETVL